jgi:hypothetical protein
VGNFEGVAQDGDRDTFDTRELLESERGSTRGQQSSKMLLHNVDVSALLVKVNTAFDHESNRRHTQDHEYVKNPLRADLSELPECMCKHLSLFLLG